MKSKDFAEIFETLESYPRKVIDVKTLIQTSEIPKYKIKARTIREERTIIRDQVDEQLQKMVQMKENFKGTYQRLKFLNNFYLYSGLSKYAEENDLSQKEIFQKSLDKYENEVMKVFNCDPEWPLCLFDFTYKNKIPQFLCFRSSANPPNFIDDYFCEENLDRKQFRTPGRSMMSRD